MKEEVKVKGEVDDMCLMMSLCKESFWGWYNWWEERLWGSG